VSDLHDLLAAIVGFEWDAGNTDKNVLGHGVSQKEAEELFFFAPIILRIISVRDMIRMERRRYVQANS
jgi:uncharacterized DUF497 family protein